MKKLILTIAILTASSLYADRGNSVKCRLGKPSMMEIMMKFNSAFNMGDSMRAKKMYAKRLVYQIAEVRAHCSGNESTLLWLSKELEDFILTGDTMITLSSGATKGILYMTEGMVAEYIETTKKDNK